MPTGRIDLHSHVLPGIDDGAEDLEDSLAMAALAADDGTEVLAATPHVRADHVGVVVAEIAERVAQVNAAIQERGIALRVVPGGEVAILEALERPEEELRAVTLGGGDTLLVETPHGPLPASFEQLLDAIRRRGFRVLLAHPELSPDFQRAPERLGAIADAGTLVQLTASSFTAPRKAPWRRLAVTALEQEWVHVVASDAHSASWRRPRLGGALAAARDTVPGSGPQLEWATREVPLAILEGREPAPRPAREPGARRGRLGRLLGR